MLYVEKTTPEDCFRLAPNLKQLDRYEVALWGMDPLQALLVPFRFKKFNEHTYTVFDIDHNVVAIFGVTPSLNDPKIGRIWLLSSDLLEENLFYFVKSNKKWLRYLEEDYNYISNYITEEQKTSIKWLKWQGFIFAKKPMLVKNVKVLYFYKRLHNVVKYGTQPILEEIGPKWATHLI
tara:strand:- start:1138 stop:1671 length:534 start_codon:yes stop_codon:yes gene_type:complete